VVPKSRPIASVLMQNGPQGEPAEGTPVSDAPFDEGFDPCGLAAARIQNQSILRDAAIKHR
jgi:hypothetical protein